MASLNQVNLIGNLGQDPEVRYLPSGDAVVTLSLATNEKWTDKDGEKQERTEWHRVVFFGKAAEIIGEYLVKGSPMYVCGKLQTKKWTDKSGVERYTTEIHGRDFQMLGSSQSGGGGRAPVAGAKAKREAGQKHDDFSDMEDDIPF